MRPAVVNPTLPLLPYAEEEATASHTMPGLWTELTAACACMQ